MKNVQCRAVKVKYLPLKCNEADFRGSTEVKYKQLRIVLKYSTGANVPFPIVVNASGSQMEQDVVQKPFYFERFDRRLLVA